jgi:hypothetical protein
MAIINDPDQITPGTEVTITPATEKITLNLAGLLSEDGITGQALYSYLKEEWKDDTEGNGYIRYPFPMLAITPEQFEFGSNGSRFSNWRLIDDASRKLMRKAGWREYDEAGGNLREYVGVVTLGNINATSKTVGNKAYYFFANDTSAEFFTYAGPVDEAVQIFGDANNGNFDKRSQALTVSIRTFGNTYGRTTTAEIDVSVLTYKVERFPVSEDVDNVIADLGVTINDIDTLAPYTDMSISWYATPQNKTGFVQAPNNANFGIVIDGDVSVGQVDGGGEATAEQIYAYVQRQLLLTTNINADPEVTSTQYIGQFVDELLNLASTGNTLSTNNVANLDAGGTGVYVDSFANDDRNRVEFTANDTNVYSFPFVATGSFQFNSNIINDSAARYWLFYQYTRENSISDLSITGASGSSATINTAGAVDFTSTNVTTGFGAGALSDQDYIELNGFTDPENNGIWQITGVPTSTSFTATKVDGATVVNDAGPVSGTLRRNPIGSPDATIVLDNSDVQLGDVLIGGTASISFTYDFDGDQAGGRNPAQSAQVTLRVIGASTAQFAEADFSIARNTGLAFPITANLERNYNGAQ